MGSDIINLVADVLISKDKSEWQTSIDAYEAEGMTEKEAFWRAVRDQRRTWAWTSWAALSPAA